MHRTALRTTCLLLCLVAAACGRKREPALPAAETTQPQPVTRAPEETARPSESEEERRRAEAERVRRVLEEMVFFDYDRSDLRDDAQATLNAKVAILKSHPELRLRIEGHADERGSVEYNLALSLRRANRVRDYLVDVGIGASRFEVAAFGEERPLVEGNDESSWSRNRRAEFAVVGEITSSIR